jgi:hypothetical protein
MLILIKPPTILGCGNVPYPLKKVPLGRITELVPEMPLWTNDSPKK